MYHTVDTIDKVIHTRELQIKMLEESAKGVTDTFRIMELGRQLGNLDADIAQLKVLREEIIEDANKPFWKKLFRK